MTVPVEIHGADLSDKDRIADEISGKVARKLDRELGQLQRNEYRRRGKHWRV